VFHHPGHRRETQHQHHLHQKTHVDADGASHFSISGFDLISYTLHAKHDVPARLSNGKQTDAVIQATVLPDETVFLCTSVVHQTLADC